MSLEPGAAPSATFDKGPPAALARHFAALPTVAEEHRELFWWSWGPVFHRGRLDGRAKVLVIASDPGPTERLVGRTLVGDAGQRVQGLLTKLGLVSGYVLVNAFPHAVHPSKASRARRLVLPDPDHLAWRNRFYDLVTGPPLEAVLALGGNAQAALALWDGAPDVPTFELPHPSAHDAKALATAWRDALPDLRAAVTPDPGGSQSGPGYGAEIVEEDYSPIPAADLPFGLPVWIGDDAWGRCARPKHHNTIERTSGDLDFSMTWQAPRLPQG
jgi:uracil-DNA glycosylase